MGGRQSVPSHVPRRAGSSSAVETGITGESSVPNRSESRSISTSVEPLISRDISGSEALLNPIEEAVIASGTVNSANGNQRSHSLRFSIPHLRSGRGLAILHDLESRRSMPLLQFIGRLHHDVRCPVCQKTVPSDDAEVHLVMCLTRPRITYNEDTLTEDKGECPICFEEMNCGCQIARLPCLCIYHKQCIDEWFIRKNCCPEHPGND